MMRFLAIALVVGWTGVASADGAFFSESGGGTAYKGGLAAYGSGALRVEFGAGYRRGPWTVELLGGGGWVEADCFGVNCELTGVQHGGSVGYFGFDLERRWPVLQSRWRGLGLRFALHAGPRYFVGTDALNGYDGPGLNAGAQIEGDIWVLGYFIDAGIDAMRLSMPVDSVTGTAPYVMIGGRVGWMSGP